MSFESEFWVETQDSNSILKLIFFEYPCMKKLVSYIALNKEKIFGRLFQANWDKNISEFIFSAFSLFSIKIIDLTKI